jgi:trimethylamine--corrinoid protein Co-methyltransferase
VGVEVRHAGAVRLFEKAGAKSQKGRIFIPQEMAEQCLKQTAKKMLLKAADSRNDLMIEAEKPKAYFGTGGQALYVLNYNEGVFEKKPAATQDLIDIVRVCEKLENVDFITRPVEPDVPEEDMDLTKTRIFLENTSKHINLANLIREEKLPEIIRMVQNKELISFIVCVLVSPLSMAESTTEKFIRIVQDDIPVAVSSCPQAGTTAPLSELGELIQVNAEVLSAVVLANLVRSGAKILYRGIPITSNLRLDVSPRWCQPDSIRRIALVSDMTHFYGIPCCGTAAVSDEKEPNPQAIAEKTLSWIFETASGAQFINSALGMLEQVLTVCLEQYIIDNMVITRIKQLFLKSPDNNLKKMAQTGVEEALSMFGVRMDSEMMEEVTSRINFIFSRQEEYTADHVQAQVDLIKKALSSGKSSSVFLKTSRSGLRRGWLFSGKRLEGKLNMEDVQNSKRDILDSFKQ